MLLHSNAHAICHRWFNEALQKLTLLPKNLGICSSMDLMSFHADQSLSLFIYFLGKVFIIQFLSYINHTLLFLRNPIGKLTIEMITSLHSTNFFDRVETMSHHLWWCMHVKVSKNRKQIVKPCILQKKPNEFDFTTYMIHQAQYGQSQSD